MSLPLDSADAAFLNDLLRAEVLAVHQHFIHILSLQAWNDTDTVTPIRAVDNVDFPNAMRIMDALIAGGYLPVLLAEASDLGDEMPRPGTDHGALFASESRVESRLLAALDAADGAVSDSRLRPLIDDPRRAHAGYSGWLAARAADISGASSPEPAPFDAAQKQAIDHLFALQIAAIGQGICHAFVHRHDGNAATADAAWTSAAAVMLQAAQIVTALAKRGLAAAPAMAAEIIEPPHVLGTSDAAAEADRVLASHCAAQAAEAATALSGTAIERILRAAAEDRTRWTAWRPGNRQPETAAPCRDFDRVLRKYVWLDAVA